MKTCVIALSLALLGLFLNGSAVAALNYRLIANVVPDAYDITIRPYLLAEDGDKQFTFDGEVAITLHPVVANLRSIVLHKNYIDITSAWMDNSAGQLVQSVPNEDLQYESSTHQLTVILRNALTLDAKYTLNFKYTGQIRSDTAGFFRANYTESTWIGITQLQRIDARTVFPCFDEPVFKATFRMHISRPKELIAFFNTQLLSTEVEADGRLLDHFVTTPIMSTYLVAFILSDFTTRGDADLAIVTRPMYYNYTGFSFDVAKKTLQAFDRYTHLPFKQLGNPIMQKAGVPKFPHNGMENWGLVIYKDVVLVQLPGYTDGWANKEYTITILMHETSHMWFGNSVTFSWWSYFWLNEAFARYYQYFMAHEIFPEYELDQQFVVNQVHLIFGNDAVNSTQPLTSPENDIQTPSQIIWKFSGIAYAKGASVVRMIRNVMGLERFDSAIRDYLKTNHLKNVNPQHLFVHLKNHWPAAQKVNLDQFFYDWTEQVGFPMLLVEVSRDRRTVTIKQQRFLLNSDDGSDANIRYTIPITYSTNAMKDFDNLSPMFYYNKTVESVAVTLEKPIDWIIFNNQQSNYYRVLYDATTLKNIKAALEMPKNGGIHVINRAHLVDDLFNYGRTGLLTYDSVFEFMEYLTNEMGYLPWKAAFTGLELVAQRLPLVQHKNFIEFLVHITENVYKELGFQRRNATDTVLDVYNRNLVASWLCKYGHEGCNSEARRIFFLLITWGRQPSPDLRETVYCAATRYGVFEYYQTLEDLYSKTKITSERELLLRSMGCTFHFIDYHYAQILAKYPPDQKLIALTPLYKQNPENVSPVFAMITSTIEKLADALGSWSSTANVISDIAKYFTTKEQEQMLKKFIDEKGQLFGSSASTLTMAADNVAKNLEWADRRLEKLYTYLSNRNSAIVNAISSTIFLIVALFYFLH